MRSMPLVPEESVVTSSSVGTGRISVSVGCVAWVVSGIVVSVGVVAAVVSGVVGSGAVVAFWMVLVWPQVSQEASVSPEYTCCLVPTQALQDVH